MINSNSRAPAHPVGETEVNIEFDQPRKERQGAYTQAPVLVLSRAENTIEIVKRATPAGSRVIVSSDLDKVADQLPSLLPGVLVLDTACVADISGTVTQLTQHFPELVVVVAGRSEDSAALMRLTAAGQIYRFLLAPLSHGQAKLTLEAAMTQHLQLGAAANRRTMADSASSVERKNYLPAYAALGAGLVVVIAGVWWFVTQMGGDSQPETNAAAGTTVAGGATSQSPAAKELALADAALAAGKLLDPPGESALDLYRSALSIDPSSAVAKAGIEQVTAKILERAESALTAEKLEEAVIALEQARDIDPNSSRLRFLDGQIDRERERLKLTQAQEVTKKIRTLLAEAATDMEAGRLLAPAGNNARESILEARKLDPLDASVAQSLRTLNGHVIDAARQAAEQGQAEQAQSYVTAARQLGFAGNELSSIERSLNEARSSATKKANVDALVGNARKRLADGQLIEPAGDSARDLLTSIRTADPARPELEDLSKSLSTRLIDAGKQATVNKQFEQAQRMLTAARQLSVKSNDGILSQAERDLAQAQVQKPAETAATAASSEAAPVQLKRTKMATPTYPAEAKRKGIEGWVDVSFLVATDGSVREVQVSKAEPQGVFDQAAMDAVKQWRFEPPLRDGKPISQRTAVRLRFNN